MNDENKRIAKNTLIMYGRLILNMIIGIYTGRVILDALGESDYGVYNVVGGFIGLFTMMTGPITGTIGRFVVFYLGKGDIQKTKDVFGTSILIMLIACSLVVLGAETIGVWFINNKMVIPHERLFAANVVFQFSIIDSVVNLMMSPYFAAFVSHEKFGIDTILSIIASIARLGICFIIASTGYDRLILYAFLLLCVSFINRFIYIRYSKRHFEETHYKIKFHKDIFKDIFSFVGWSMFEAVANVGSKQGGNILLNLFGGPVANAASGIAGTIRGLATALAGNFTASFSPQLTKSYASCRYERTVELINYGTKISYYLVLIFTIPILLNIDWVLDLWLVKVPQHTASFIRISFITVIFGFFSSQLATAKHAVGNIKYFKILTSLVSIFVLPISYVMLKIGYPVEFIFIVQLFASIIQLFVNMYCLRGDIPGLSLKSFFLNVVCNGIFVAIFSSIIPTYLWLNMDDGFIRVFITSIVSVLMTVIVILYIGCNKFERQYILNKMRIKLRKH